MPETPREMADRHVREQEARIFRQRALIDKLAATGESTKLAEDTLELMERTKLMPLR